MWLPTLIACTILSSAVGFSQPSEEDYRRFALFEPFSVYISVRTIVHDAVPLPTPVAQPLPEYPLEVRQHGAGGIIGVHVRVTEKGQLKIVRFTKTDKEEPQLEDAVRAALAKWKFLPAKRKEMFVACELEYTFDFRFLP